MFIRLIVRAQKACSFGIFESIARNIFWIYHFIFQKGGYFVFSTLLSFVREWNTNAKKSVIAQRVLRAILATYSPEVLRSCEINLKQLADALLVYTERHLDRVNKLVRNSFLIDYTFENMGFVVNPTEEASTLEEKEFVYELELPGAPSKLVVHNSADIDGSMAWKYADLAPLPRAVSPHAEQNEALNDNITDAADGEEVLNSEASGQTQSAQRPKTQKTPSVGIFDDTDSEPETETKSLTKSPVVGSVMQPTPTAFIDQDSDSDSDSDSTDVKSSQPLSTTPLASETSKEVAIQIDKNVGNVTLPNANRGVNSRILATTALVSLTSETPSNFSVSDWAGQSSWNSDGSDSDTPPKANLATQSASFSVKSKKRTVESIKSTNRTEKNPKRIKKKISFFFAFI